MRRIPGRVPTRIRRRWELVRDVTIITVRTATLYPSLITPPRPNWAPPSTPAKTVIPAPVIGPPLISAATAMMAPRIRSILIFIPGNITENGVTTVRLSVILLAILTHFHAINPVTNILNLKCWMNIVTGIVKTVAGQTGIGTLGPLRTPTPPGPVPVLLASATAAIPTVTRTDLVGMMTNRRNETIE